MTGERTHPVPAALELLTPRLRLRRWRDADREPFAAMNADPEVMRYFPAPLDRRQSDALVDLLEERFATQGFGPWALERLEDRRFLGFTGLNPMPPGTPGAGGMEVGWRLTRTAWGHGYATEAATVALGLAAGPLGLSPIWSITAVANVASQAVMRRLGLVEHSRYRHPALPLDHPLTEQVAFWSGPRRAMEAPSRR